MNTAKIVGITQSFIKHETEDRNLTADEFIAYCARVSNPSNQMNTLTAPKLLKYLVNNKHWSPFELVSVTMEVNTTRDIGRQLLRHRSFSFQEFSQRYADPTKDMGFVTREARLQDKKNRQASTETDDKILIDEWEAYQRGVKYVTTEAYKWAVENGIAKEQARVVLPEGLVVTKLYTQGTLRSWIHYIQLRESNGTQKEHREVALAAKAEIIKYFPSLKEVLQKE